MVYNVKEQLRMTLAGQWQSSRQATSKKRMHGFASVVTGNTEIKHVIYYLTVRKTLI